MQRSWQRRTPGARTASTASSTTSLARTPPRAGWPCERSGDWKTQVRSSASPSRSPDSTDHRPSGHRRGRAGAGGLRRAVGVGRADPCGAHRNRDGPGRAGQPRDQLRSHLVDRRDRAGGDGCCAGAGRRATSRTRQRPRADRALGAGPRHRCLRQGRPAGWPTERPARCRRSVAVRHAGACRARRPGATRRPRPPALGSGAGFRQPVRPRPGASIPPGSRLGRAPSAHDRGHSGRHGPHKRRYLEPGRPQPARPGRCPRRL